MKKKVIARFQLGSRRCEMEIALRKKWVRFLGTRIMRDFPFNLGV